MPYKHPSIFTHLEAVNNSYFMRYEILVSFQTLATLFPIEKFFAYLWDKSRDHQNLYLATACIYHSTDDKFRIL